MDISKVYFACLVTFPGIKNINDYSVEISHETKTKKSAQIGTEDGTVYLFSRVLGALRYLNC